MHDITVPTRMRNTPAQSVDFLFSEYASLARFAAIHPELLKMSQYVAHMDRAHKRFAEAFLALANPDHAAE